MSEWADPLPDDFVVPEGLRTEQFLLEPLDHRHNAADLAAWTSSIEHIRSTPGFAGRSWPSRVFTPEENDHDITMHAEHARDRVGFTYTVLEPSSGDVIGCVYVYPPKRDGYDVDVRSWVRATHADLDRPLYETTLQWLADEWPFSRPDYAAR